MIPASDPEPHRHLALGRALWRDVAWRTVGGALILAGSSISGLSGSGMALLGIVVAFAGLVLLVQGRRAVLALRVERSRHRELPRAIHVRRMRRGRDPIK